MTTMNNKHNIPGDVDLTSLNRFLGSLGRRHAHLERRIQRIEKEDNRSASLSFDEEEYEALSCAIPVLERYRAECASGVHATDLLVLVLPLLKGKDAEPVRKKIERLLQEART